MIEILDNAGIVPYGKTPNERQLEHLKMEKKAFIHFGVNTFTNLEWGAGTESEKAFSPHTLDVEQWIRVVKDAGFKLVILTAKHHDGFCLWPSKYTTHTVEKSPYKNGNGDIVAEFCNACRKYGLKAGIYISPWDRSVKEWGTPYYSEFFANQLTELLTNYGRLDEIWWDGAGSGETEYDWDLWSKLVRTFQPTAAIFGSNGALDTVDLRWVGNERGIAGETHFGSINCSNIKGLSREKLYFGEQHGSVYLPSETDVSIRPGWFYHEDQDLFVKNPCVLDNIWFTSVGRNSQLLLNFPPNKDGLICERDAEFAKISNDNIEKMRSVNYINEATLTADTSLLPETNAKNLKNIDENKIYASAKNKNEAIIDMTFAKPFVVNVLALREVVEYGERINKFRLVDISEKGERILCEGTSVGFYRVLKFPTGAYSHLRLYVGGAASVLLRKIDLHYYEPPKFDMPSAIYGKNIIRSQEIDTNGAVLGFGGIFEFNEVRAILNSPGEYNFYIFDGQNYHLFTKGNSDTRELIIKLSEPISECYQIKLVSETGFAEEPLFKVSLERR